MDRLSERLGERLGVAARALQTFEELALMTTPSAVERDAAIQRFEYSFEAVWKCAQRYLQDVEKLISGSPRAVIRSSRELGLLNDEQAVLALAMCDDRNLTAHTYNEALAVALFGRLPEHARLLRTWLEAVRRQAQG